MDYQELINGLKRAMGEADVAEEVLTDEAPEAEVQATPEPEQQESPIKDTMTLADTLDAKAKIARCLENLKASVEDFKNATAEKVDLIADSALIKEIEGLDLAIEGIETVLASGELLKSELNDPFKAELPAEPVEQKEQEVQPESEETKETEEEPTGEFEFDNLAGLELLPDEKEV